MQLSFDSRGNSVPTILLMMQRRLYTQGGLQVYVATNTLNPFVPIKLCLDCLVHEFCKAKEKKTLRLCLFHEFHEGKVRERETNKAIV